MDKFINRYSILIIIFCFLFACKNKSEISIIVNKWQGKQFVLPDDSLMINTYRKNINPLSKKQKIVAVIDASCGVCVSELKDWEVFMKDIDTNKVGFIFLLHSIDKLMIFEKLNSSLIHFSYPYFYDIRKMVICKNNIPENKLFQTFLLDSTNHVVLIGNPIRNNELATLYKSEIRKTISSKN